MSEHRVMMVKSSAVLILAGLTLAGCATQQERAAKRAASEQAAQDARVTRCASFGYKAGTPDYSHCLENQYAADQQKAVAEEVQRQARVQAIADGLQQTSAALSAINPPPSPMVVCHTFGNTTTCQ